MTRGQALKNIRQGLALVGRGGLYAIDAADARSQPDDGTLCARRPFCELPIIHEADVVVVGGATAGVAAAWAAAGEGASVFLISGEPYLGGDVCGAYRYWDIGPVGGNELARRLYRRTPPTPNDVKRGLEEILLERDVPFLLSSYVSNILVDADGGPAGVVFANRSGEQIVRTRLLIDATERAACARLAGAAFTEYPDGDRDFYFTVLGNSPRDGYPAEQLEPPFRCHGQSYRALRYRLKLPMRDGSVAAFAEAEQKALDIVWDADQVDAADMLFQVAPDHVIGLARHAEDAFDSFTIGLGCFIPEKHRGLYVLGAAADISRPAAARLLEPLNMLALGERLGRQAAHDAAGRARPEIAVRQRRHVSAISRLAASPSATSGEFRIERIRIEDERLPILGEYDVVVVGGGTCGAPAAIGAARQGAKVLLVEYLHGLGGVGTMGLIGGYWFGYPHGFNTQAVRGEAAMGRADHPRHAKVGRKVEEEKWKWPSWNRDWKMEWLRREIREKGGDIWFGALGCGALVEGSAVRGVVLATPQGKGAVLADKVIDATGSGDIAIAAGAGYDTTGAESLAVQGAGLPCFNPDVSYFNTDYMYVDDADVLDLTRAFVSARKKYRSEFDVGKMVDTRERRRVRGDFRITAMDVCNNRTYPDTISIHRSNFDSHSVFFADPFFDIVSPEYIHELNGHEAMIAEAPLRALLPAGLEHILAIGLGMSAHRDALPVLRMQPDLENQGYAAGLLSAAAVKAGREYRQMDLRPIQEALVAMGNLPPRILDAGDNFHASREDLVNAADALPEDFRALGILCWNLQEAIPLLRERLRQSGRQDARLAYALVLGHYGHPDGWLVLREAVDALPDWDERSEDRGFGAIGSGTRFSEDSLIIALGRCGQAEALPSIHRMARKLDLTADFRHFRAIAVACESIGNPASATVLHDLLTMPGMQGYAIASYREAIFVLTSHSEGMLNRYRYRNDNPRFDFELIERTLKEVFLARALYRCGDQDGLGRKILEAYASDLRGHYARHAREILNR